MSRRFNVHLNTHASSTITVTISDSVLTQVATDLGVSVADLTNDDLRERIIEQAYEKTPTICAHCSGWDSPGVSLNLGDEWELSDEPEFTSIAWLAPALRAHLDPTVVSMIDVDALVARLHHAAAEHARDRANRDPAVEEVTDTKER